MAKAILYVRVSTREQAEEGVSLQAQEKALRAYCDLGRLEITELVVDSGVSGGKPLSTRPGGARVLNAIKTGQADAVVAWKLDRLFRDAVDCLTATTAWDKRGVAVHLVDLGGSSVDTSSAMGRFFLTVMAGMAEMERNRIRERTAAAMQYKKSQREFCGGDVAYGWTMAGDGVHIEPEPTEQAHLHDMKELRTQGLSLRAVGAELELRGVLTRSHKSWHPQSIKAALQSEAA